MARATKEGAGLTKGTPHTLRHTFASHLAMLGASMQEIQRLLGHKDLKTTLIYAHLSPGHLTQTVARFDTAK